LADKRWRLRLEIASGIYFIRSYSKTRALYPGPEGSNFTDTKQQKTRMAFRRKHLKRLDIS
jgi:hypothetical protein